MKIICIILVLLGFNFNLSFDNVKVNICSIQNKNRDVFSLNCDSLINVYRDHSIRSILPDSLSSIYMQPSIEGRFVRYILIADSMIYDEPAGDIIGSLVVYETKNCNRRSLFVEFISNIFPTISVYNNRLKVGSSTDDLVKELGTPYKIIEDHYLYKSLSNDLAGIYSTKNGNITSFRIGKYNKKTLSSIEGNLELLLKHNP
jgi:hypothetical protein